MHSFSLLFLAALALGTAIQLWLLRRQQRHVATHRDRVPEPFAEKIPLAAHQKAADYTLAKVGLGYVEVSAGALILLAWTLGGGLDALQNLWHAVTPHPLLSGVGLLLSVVLIMGLLDLPLTVYRTFSIEQRFGFNRTQPAVFISDQAKQVVLTLLLGAPLALLVLWLMTSAGALWWLYVWVTWMGFSLLILWAYPAFIAPLFNRFSPLADAELEQRIRQLLERCGFTYRGVFVMDGSRRSAHGNAYFTGLGNNKRIVFFDTLLEHLSADEIEAVLAHELGHFRRKHVRKRLVTMALMSLLALALLGWLVGQPWFYTGLGVETPTLAAALLLFLLVTPTFTLFLQPLMAGSMRRHEFEADDFAAEQVDAEGLVRALVKLYEENASTLTPDPLYSAFHDSHPPAPVRIAHLSRRLQERTA